MGTTKEQISEWFDRGVKQGATHMIVVCDTYDWEDYPKYVMPDQDVREEEEKSNGSSMQQVMEVYKLSESKARQMKELRCFRY
jgi:hypothetical protein